MTVKGKLKVKCLEMGLGKRSNMIFQVKSLKMNLKMKVALPTSPPRLFQKGLKQT